jgi:hypothetical protein
LSTGILLGSDNAREGYPLCSDNEACLCYKVWDEIWDIIETTDCSQIKECGPLFAWWNGFWLEQCIIFKIGQNAKRVVVRIESGSCQRSVGGFSHQFIHNSLRTYNTRDQLQAC